MEGSYMKVYTLISLLGMSLKCKVIKILKEPYNTNIYIHWHILLHRLLLYASLYTKIFPMNLQTKQYEWIITSLNKITNTTFTVITKQKRIPIIIKRASM
jgi:hypothetical protein